MIRSQMVRRGWAALITATTLLLAACGGSDSNDSSGNASLRILNATSDVPSLDVYLGDTKSFSAVAVDTVTAATSVGANSYDIKLTAAGSTTSLLTSNFGLSKDKHYTGVAWGRKGALRFVTLPEDDDTASISASNSRVRIYNATSDVGALDVYLTQGDAEDDLSNMTPVVDAALPGTLGGHRDVTAGTYRLRVTGAGKPSDVRLNIAGVTLTAKQYATLIVTAGPSSVLVHSAMLVQQGTLTQLKNTKARIRLVASVEAAGTVTMQVAGSTVSSPLMSPFDGPYALVNAGTPVVSLDINGAAGPSAPMALVAGADYSLLAYGPAATAQMKLLPDDNRLPGANSYRVRLVNGAAGAAPVTLVMDDGVVLGLNDIPSLTASTYTAGPADSSVDVKVTSGSTTLAPLLPERNLQALGVYTVWVLGGNAAPTVLPRKDR